MVNGFLRVAAAVPHINVADVDHNIEQISLLVDRLEKEQVDVAVFPEMCITGYTCGDLFHNTTLINAALAGLDKLRKLSERKHLHFIVGLPVAGGGTMYNCAALLRDGEVELVAKSYIPNYNEFYERRWWRPGAVLTGDFAVTLPSGETATVHSSRVFSSHGVNIAIEICEDLWVPVPPSCHLAMGGAEVVFNLSASDDLIGKYRYLTSLIKQQSARCLCAYVYAGAGWGESSTDLTFDGKAIIAENGSILAVNRRWSPDDNISIADIDIEMLRHDRLHTTTFADCAEIENNRVSVENPRPETDHVTTRPLSYRTVDPRPFVPADDEAIDDRCDEIINIQVAALARRLDAIRCKTIVVGISGGLDSTLALLVAAKTFDRLNLDRKGIIGVTMPGFGTTGRTHGNAVALMESLGITMREISIVKAVNQHFEDIGHNPAVHDVTYENSQARERTQLLMDIANQAGGIVLGTGDLSELALGWATYNGDQMSMYGINAGIPKTLVRYLVRWFATRTADPKGRDALNDIIDTPISPELTPADEEGNIKQKTEDLVGPYELHDFFLYYMLRYSFSPQRIYTLARKAFDPTAYPDDVIKHWMRTFFRRFFNQQFKRSCMPDGPKVGSVCLSPRGDWRMPSDASSTLWLKEVDSL